MLITLTNTPRDYAWGSTTLIADLEGRAPTGRPEAEVWFGDHPGSPARVVGAARDEHLGEWRRRHGGTDGSVPLPHLTKILAAGGPLSIQVHPSREQAREGFARDEAAGIPRDADVRNYRDDNHKPEVIVALGDTFEALAGLRPVADTLRLLDALEPGAGVAALRAQLAGADEADALRGALRWVLAAGHAEQVGEVISAARTARSAEFADELNAVERIARVYPGDPGVVVALLMNHVTLRRGEALFVPAGALHAYLGGLGVEVMAASDNVLRGGLTGKHIDVDELLRVVDTRAGLPTVLAPVALAAGADLFAPDIDDFAVLRVDAVRGLRVVLDGDAVVVSTGASDIAGPSTSVHLEPGQGAFVTADEAHLDVSGGGAVFFTLTGRSRVTVAAS